MIALLVVFAYALAGLLFFGVSAPRLAWKRARNYGQSQPDRLDKQNAVMDAAMLSVIWPVVLPSMLAFRGSRLILLKFFASEDFWAEPKTLQGPVSRYRDNKHQRQRAEIEAKRKRVNEVEAELGWKLTEWEN